MWTDEFVADFNKEYLDLPLTDAEELAIADLVDCTWWLYGRSESYGPRAPDACYFQDFAAMMAEFDMEANDSYFVDTMEVMGGEARVTQCLVRRRFKSGVKAGRNFDLVCGCDLTDEDDQKDMWTYTKRAKPLVIIMAPPCAGMKGWSALNRVINPTAWAHTRANSVFLGRICGELARYQLTQGRHFLREHPLGTELNN